MLPKLDINAMAMRMLMLRLSSICIRQSTVSWMCHVVGKEKACTAIESDALHVGRRAIQCPLAAMFKLYAAATLMPLQRNRPPGAGFLPSAAAEAAIKMNDAASLRIGLDEASSWLQECVFRMLQLP